MAQDLPINQASDWCLIVGAARTWPNLASANHDIKVIQRQLGSSGAIAGTLPTWADTITGNFAAGLQRRLPFMDGRLWLGCMFSNAQGPISHSRGVTQYSALGTHFEQVYRYQGYEALLLLDILTFKRFVATFAVSCGVNNFSSDTDVAVFSQGLLFNNHSRSSFSDIKPSIGLQMGCDVLLTRNLALNMIARYSWCTFSGSSPVASMTSVQGQLFQQVQPKHVLVDVSGPSLGLYLKLFI
ncbi:MAG: hypothetical protein ACLGSA_02005 [Acidobacteriota bacterium]